jgi:sterol desaturase/sphingolipid hydroxylase (fatty acid hydroxylase superfamily)
MESISIIVLSVGLVMILAERLRPRSHFRKPKGWWTRTILLNCCQALVVLIAGLYCDPLIQRISTFDLSQHSTFKQVVLGYLLITFIYYWWHRARHQNSFLWRTLHQIHHSTTSLEVAASFYKHPLEMLVNSILSSLILYAILGLSLEAATITILITGIAELIYHWNVKTPYWLGFLFQRPESHCVHHAEGHHKQNYSDLPLWDLLFGTFYNPKDCPTRCGFKDDGAVSFKRMAIFKRVF